MHWLMDPSTPVVLLLGPAGCGKTALAVAAAIRGLINATYNKVLLTRVDVAAGDPIGFMKGELNEKNAPWIAPMMNEF